MSRSARRAFLLGIAALIGLGIFAWIRPGDETTERDRVPLPPPSEPPRDARPVLRSAALLPGGYGCIKPTIAADRDGRTLVVAMDGSAGGLRGFRLVRWRSEDGGSSWKGPAPIAGWPDGSEVIFDPWLLTDHRGRFHLTNGAWGPQPGDSSPVVFSRSLDGGSTWQRPVAVAEYGDRPMLAISPDGKELVIAFATIDPKTMPKAVALSEQEAAAALAAIRHVPGVLRSGDRGRTWEAVAGPPGLGHAIPFGVACDDSGRIACCWVDSDGRGEGSRSIVCTTDDGGQTWETTELVGRLQPDRDHPFNGGRFPVLTADGEGVLHVALVAAGGTGLSVRSSRDWRTWGEPARLSSDGADEVRFPSIAAGGRVIHVTWMERQGGRYRMWYRGSKDQGAVWSDPLLISRPRSISGVEDEAFDIVSDDDQASLADDGAGVAHAVWALRGSRRGGGEIWHATITWQSPDR